MLSLKLLAPISVVSLFLLHTHIPLHPTPVRFSTTPPNPPHPFCVVYDRPPRTGSSTVAAALRICLQSHGFHQPELLSRPQRHHLVAQMLSLPHQRVALVSHHVYISRHDIDLLRQGCQRLFYVTSASGMRGRVWSAIKYSLVGRRYNGEIAGKVLRRARHWAMVNKRWEPYLEHYPYLVPGADGQHEEGWGVRFGERLIPDYVIRKDNMDEELAAMLKQLGCDQKKVVNRNVHRVGEHVLPPEIPLEKKDQVFRWLNTVGDMANEAGLRKLGDFVERLGERRE
eukprot:GFKZ01012414.1.p1 GENE.GFKZ01012414.1~~GFKZ01012414.1.p1  ORF type:complete len:284 (+),score=31.56 GFKZ01012414.1:434-1285(+)